MTSQRCCPSLLKPPSKKAAKTRSCFRRNDQVEPVALQAGALDSQQSGSGQVDGLDGGAAVEGEVARAGAKS